MREIPVIPEQKIGPNLSNEQHERREKENSLTRYIQKWWRGDAHVHSKESTRPGWGYTEGLYDLSEIAKYYDSLGLEFVGITEHASKPGAPSVQTPDSPICQSLLAEARVITEYNRERRTGAKLLSGVETSIVFDEQGRAVLDVPNEVLQNLDLVIASRHAIANEKEPTAIKQTLLAAASNPQVAVIGHPDRYSRKDKEKSPDYWNGYWGIWPEILMTMKANNVAFEINFNNPPSRKLLDMAVKAGLKFFLNYDAHDFNQFKKEQSELMQAGQKAKGEWAKNELDDEGEEILEHYKQGRLSSGPGYRAISLLVRQLKKLENAGVTPDRIVNSSRENLVKFLVEQKGKKTENLLQLQAN